MDAPPRFDIFRENHIGFGVRWKTGFGYPVLLSFAFPFFTITVGIGPCSN